MEGGRGWGEGRGLKASTEHLTRSSSARTQTALSSVLLFNSIPIFYYATKLLYQMPQIMGVMVLATRWTLSFFIPSDVWPMHSRTEVMGG